MAHPKILAFVLAGGKGQRLHPLTALRSKPSVPFGGRYRIVDFVLSNLVNSRIYSIYLLVQYASQSLIEHIRQNWVLSPILKDHFIAVVPPQMRMGPAWFQGTADAVYQNFNLIYDHKPELVVVFGADHVYRMDIRQMIDFHLERDALVTVAAIPVPIEKASSFGVIVTDHDNRITAFQEKPEHPAPRPGDPSTVYASMGNYIFKAETLLRALFDAQEKKHHDFGTHIIPELINTGKIFAYDFATNAIPGIRPYEETGYWRDVGTIGAFFDSHMDLLSEFPRFDLLNKLWPIHPAGHDSPAAKILGGEIHNSVISEGDIIHGARIIDSIIRRDVILEDDVLVEQCIIMDNSVLKKGCRLKKTIVDKYNTIEEGLRIGFDPEQDCQLYNCHIDPVSSIAVIQKGERLIKGLRTRSFHF